MNANKLIKYRKGKITCKIIEVLLQRKGITLPRQVKLGNNVIFPHNSVGTVIHPNCKIEDNVKIYQNVTIGRADIYAPI